ncbi:hypothetical protein JCM11641_000087 [Rhodosporidiobolus odoratus]
MASLSRYTTSTAFLEQVSAPDILTYTVPTTSRIDDTAPPPQLAQPDDHAIASQTFFPSTKATTGFVLARVVEDGFALELRWVAFSRKPSAGTANDGMDDDASSPPPQELDNLFSDLDAHPGTLPPVRLIFPSPLVPSPSFALSPSSPTSHLEVYAVTEAGYLYVLSFPLESLFYGPELGVQEDSADWSDEFRLESLEGRSPVLVKGVEDGRVVVGCADGFVACVDFAEDGTLLETELKSLSSFSIRSLVPSFSSRNLGSPTKSSFASPAASQSSPSQLISLASSFSSLSTFAFGLSRDRKLKIWNFQTGSAQPPIDIAKLITSHSSSALTLASPSHSDSNFTTSGLLSSTPQTFLKTLQGSTSTSHTSYLALFVPPSSSSSAAFVICGLEVDPNTGELSTLRPIAERVCPPSLASSGSLVDFSVAKMDLNGQARWTLWTVWDEAGETELRTIGVPELQVSGAEGGVGVGVDEVWITVERGEPAKTALWTAGYFDEQLRGSKVSVAETFLRHISVPGRYPPATLEFALEEYEELVRSELEAVSEGEEPEAFGLEYASALQRAAAIVGCTVRLEQSPQTGAFLHDEFNKRLKLEWLRFVALLNESRTAALFPTHLAVNQERGVVAVVGRDSLSVPYGREAVHTLSTLNLGDIQAQQSLLIAHLQDPTSLVDLPPSAELNQDHTLRADLLPLLSAIKTLEARLAPAEQRTVELTVLETLRSPAAAGAGGDIEDVALDLFERALEPLLPDEALKETVAALAALDSADRAVEAFLRLLVADQVSPPFSCPSSSFGAATDLSASLLTSAFSTSISSRYSLAKGLVTLLLVVWAAEDDSVIESDVLGSSDALAGERLFGRLDQTTAQALTVLKGLAAAQWVVAEISTPSSEAIAALQAGAGAEGGEGDGLTERFGELKMGAGKKKQGGGGGGAETSPVPVSGILDALFRIADYAPSLSSTETLPRSLAYALSSLSSSLGLLPSPSASPSADSPSRLHTELSTTPPVTTLAYRLLQFGLPAQAAEFAAFWPRTCGMEYVVGRAALELGEGEEAVRAFGRAVGGVYADEDDDEGEETAFSDLAHLLPSSISSSPSRFYIHLVHLFLPTSFEAAVAHFAHLALESLEEEGIKDEVTEKDLWVKVFRSYAAIGAFEQAYEAIMAAPYHETQMTCLAHFISIVCENGATSLLTSYSFAGLEADLERNLAFRARNSDPLARPNYYKVLYAYHVSKGDYRSAATTMYQQSRRLGELATCSRGQGAFAEFATLQCQSLLAAANALALVRKEHAWIAVVGSAADEGERGHKRRKIVFQIPEQEFDPAVASRAPEVLEVADVRKEYATALARLQLVGEFPELERTNFHLDPEAVVALFSQTGAFEQAFSAGAVLDADLSSLFEAVAERCVALSMHPEGSQDASWVTLSEEATTWDDSLSSKAWRLLENHLERHDSSPTWRYRLVVLERVLATNRGGKVPAFLSEFLLKRDSQALIRTLVKYDRLAEAFEASMKAIQASPAQPSASSTTLPYSLHDQLLAIPPGDSPHLSDDVLKQKQQELRETLEKRWEKVEKAQRQVLRG